MTFQLNDVVIVKYHKDNKDYKAIIIDIENCPKYIRQQGRPVVSDEREYTGRYGVKFTDQNPTIIDLPYFWEKELTLYNNPV